jgi:hypothetical protein
MTNLVSAVRKLLGEKEDQFDSWDRDRFAEARLGHEVKTRLGPILSDYLETEAQATRLRALEQLEKASPTDVVKIASLQVDARAAAKALTWLVNAVERGMIAEDQLRQRDEESQDE